MAKVGAQSMPQVTTHSPVCAKDFSTVLKQAERVVPPVNGQLEKLKCSQSNTKQRAVDTNHEGTPEVFKGLDKAEVAYQEWQALYSRPESYRGALSTGESYQGSFGQRVCRYYESQAEGRKPQANNLLHSLRR
jgi:hypothetical protein